MCSGAGGYSRLRGKRGWLPRCAAIRAGELRKQCFNYSHIRRYAHDHYRRFEGMPLDGRQLSQGSLHDTAEQKLSKPIPARSNPCHNAPKDNSFVNFKLVSMCSQVSIIVSFIRYNRTCLNFQGCLTAWDL